MPDLIFPDGFIDRLQPLLGPELDDFIAAHYAPSPVSIRLNPSKTPIDISDSDPVRWCETGFYLKHRPVFSKEPAFHSGSYYVQGASSMFLEQYMNNYGGDQPMTVLDLCAAPGGKSTHLLSMVHPDSMVVCNEVIRSRGSMLIQNLSRWGSANSIITQSDPKVFESVGPIFDWVIVDAPCSGEGLFRKIPDAAAHWSEKTVEICADRQKRILRSAVKVLKPGGILVYSTCTYEPAENIEQLISFILQEGFESLHVSIPEDLGILQQIHHISGKPLWGYTFLPHRVMGDGFFISAARKPSRSSPAHSGRHRQNLPRHRLPRETLNGISDWLPDSQLTFYSARDGQIFGYPASWSGNLHHLIQQLNVRSVGAGIGRMRKTDLIPAHSLALYPPILQHVPTQAVLDAEARQFLTKSSVLDFPDCSPGWTLLTYNGNGLGWIKKISRRINNYYPSAWRIQN